jgi:hypothetical protein
MVMLVPLDWRRANFSGRAASHAVDSDAIPGNQFSGKLRRMPVSINGAS